MIIALVVILTGILATAYDGGYDKTRIKKIMFFLWIFMVLVTSFRGLNAIADTSNYYYYYASEPLTTPLKTFFHVHKNEPVYFMLGYFMSNMGIPWQIYLLLHSMFVFGVVLSWLYRYSEMPLLSTLIFESMFMGCYIIAMRYSLGMAFLLLAYMCFDKGLQKRGIVFVVLGILSHNSIVVLIPFYFIRRIKITDKIMIGYLILCGITYLVRNKFFMLMNTVAAYIGRNTYEMTEGETTYGYFFLMMAICFLALLFCKVCIAENEKYSEYLHTLFLSLALFNIVGGGVKLRMVYCYAIFICLMLPNILRHIQPVFYSRTVLASLAVMYMLFQRDYMEYYFFWRDGNF